MNNNKEDKNGLGDENKIVSQKKSGSLEQNRVVIDKDANKILEKEVLKANKGFDAGIITKSDLANYVFQHLDKFLTESDFKKLRSLHFDDKKVLSDLVRKTDDTKDLPEEIRRALREHYGLVDKDKKRSSRIENDLSTEGSVDNP